MVERDDSEFEAWPAAPDPIRVAVGNLLAEIIRHTADGSRQRARAMTAALEAHERIADALRDQRTLN